jgi:phenylacetate-CoA ligase
VRLGKPFWEELRFLEASTRYSAAELEELQNDRLRKLIVTAYRNVPYYRDIFDNLKLEPGDIRSAADLAKLPVLEKRTVAHEGERMFNRALPESQRIHGHTSGSTGTSLRLIYDHVAMGAEFATVWRMRRRYGCDINRWHATFAGRVVVPLDQAGPPFHRTNYPQRQVLFSLYHLKPDTVEHYLRALQKRPFEFYSGYPSSLDALIGAAAKAGLTPPGPSKAIFTSSESLLLWQRRQLEEAFRVPVYDRYGCAEFCVSFTVCPQGRYHLDSEFSITEVEPLVENADIVQGPLLCTGLMNHAMPFIRYRVGDVATIAKTPCSCGNPSLSALAIDGRSEDFVLTHDGVRLGRLDHLFKDMYAIRESQILQDRPGRMKIRIVRAPEYGMADEEQLLRECSKRMGGNMDVELDYVDSIPRNAAGKFRAVINTIPDAQRYA